MSVRLRLATLALLAGTALPSDAQTRASTSDRDLAREIFRELVAIDTSEPDGNPRVASEAIAARLRSAGFARRDIEVVGAEPRLANLVARLRGSDSAPPLLLLAHLDVVPARRDDWSMDPFRLIEKDGFFYGRGSHDNKAGAAILTANLMRLKRDGFQPSRDVVVALTTDEETTGNAISWLLANHSLVKRAGLALNSDGGEGLMQNGRKLVLGVQASEKLYVSYQLAVRNPGGHSSVPRSDNAIYQLARALDRLSKHEFPARLSEVTRAYLARTAELGGPDAADFRAAAAIPPDSNAIKRLLRNPSYASTLRTTCVATMVKGGHAENALPQTATAIVNCRVLPDEKLADVQRALVDAVADPDVAITQTAEATPSPPSPLTKNVISTLEELSAKHFPGVLVIPEMSAGATDGLFVRNAGIPVYGVAAIFSEPDDVRAHGRDERVAVQSFYEALDFWYDMTRAFAR